MSTRNLLPCLAALALALALPAPAGEGTKDEQAPAPPPAPPATFPEPRAPDPIALANALAARSPPPEPDKNARQEIFRVLRNFADTNDAGRRKTLRTLQDYGRMAEPFIAAAYTDPADFDYRVSILAALAVPGRPLTTPCFAGAHRTALAQFSQAGAAAPPRQSTYVSKRDRERPASRGELLQLAAANVFDLEGYMSVAGGPFNALYLLDVYKQRYSSDKTEPLLMGLPRDRARLAATAADVGRSRSSWTTADRIGLAELTLPLLFKDNDDLQSLAKDLLKKLLPSGYPKWDAPQEDWVEWWGKARPKLQGKR